MSLSKKGGPAFPRPGYNTQGQEGMSLRAYFAGQFAVGLVTFENGENLSRLFGTKEERASANCKQEPEEFFAQVAVQLADALIAELAKTP